jgi:hypothetical protein
LLVPSGTLSDPSRHHLFVLVTNACNANFHLAISISSIKSGISHDPTCIIEKDEHPFVDLRSYVVYARPQQLLRPNIVTRMVVSTRQKKIAMQRSYSAFATA